MSSFSQHEQFRRALIRAGVPRRRRRRLLDEYADHRAELEKELADAGQEAELDERVTARLGEPEVLAELALQRLRSESFAGRHPVLGFTLLPALSLVVALVLAMLLTLIPWAMLGQDRMVHLLGAVWPVILFVLPMVGGLAWYRAALRRGRGHRYGWLAALVFGMPTTFVSTRVIASDIPLRSAFQFVPETAPGWPVLPLLLACVAALSIATAVRQRALVDH